MWTTSFAAFVQLLIAEIETNFQTKQRIFLYNVISLKSEEQI